MSDDTGGGLRVDKWLWFIRFYKTRSLAAAAVSGGHVKVNGERVKQGHRIVPGDTLEITRDSLPWELVVTALPVRRGPAAEARACYSESAAAEERRERIVRSIRQDRLLMPRTPGRPDKHTRRKLRDRNRRADTE